MSSEVIAANLRRIRGAKEKTQTDIAAAAGLSVAAYRNIELGKAQPRVRNLQGLADALGVPMRSLLEQPVVLRNVRFRSRKKLRTRSQILVDVGRWLADYNQLEDLLDERREYKLRALAPQPGVGHLRAAATARAARTMLGLSADEPIRDICGLLDAAGVKVFPMSIASDAFFGLSVAPSDGGPAIAVNTWTRISVERWIFTAAHELGHLLLHLDDYARDDADEDPDHETEADAFAAEFLMPDAVFRREWQATYGLSLVERVIKVKRMFRVSYRTVLHRISRSAAPGVNLWARFAAEYKRSYNRSLAGEEPDALPPHDFHSAEPEPNPGAEPAHLTPADFHEDRLASLVRRAIEAGEISFSRGAEILGLPLRDLRARAAYWVD